MRIGQWIRYYYITEVLQKLSFQKSEKQNIQKIFHGDFIAKCRAVYIHDYDIVEGPMADDTIWNFVNDFFAGNISRKVFWDYAEFKHPTHQISFHSLKALDCLKFERSEQVNEQ